MRQEVCVLSQDISKPKEKKAVRLLPGCYCIKFCSLKVMFLEPVSKGTVFSLFAMPLAQNEIFVKGLFSLYKKPMVSLQKHK